MRSAGTPFSVVTASRRITSARSWLSAWTVATTTTWSEEPTETFIVPARFSMANGLVGSPT